MTSLSVSMSVLLFFFFQGSSVKSVLLSFRLDLFGLCLITDLDYACVRILRHWYRPHPSKVKDWTKKCNTMNNYMNPPPLKNSGVRNISFGNALLFIINQEKISCGFCCGRNIFVSNSSAPRRVSHVWWISENQCWIQAVISLSFACVSSACPHTLIFKASFSGQRDRSSLKCPSLWLPEIRPHISNIREGNIGTKKESRWLSQHPTVHNNLNLLFVCVIGRICGLLISLSSASPNLTHLPYSLLICLLSIILIYLPGELQIESSRRRSQTWPTFKGLSGKTSLKPIKSIMSSFKDNWAVIIPVTLWAYQVDLK